MFSFGHLLGSLGHPVSPITCDWSSKIQSRTNHVIGSQPRVPNFFSFRCLFDQSRANHAPQGRVNSLLCLCNIAIFYHSSMDKLLLYEAWVSEGPNRQKRCSRCFQDAFKMLSEVPLKPDLHSEWLDAVMQLRSPRAEQKSCFSK